MKQLLINCENLETRVAVVENGKLLDYFVERNDRDRLSGSIFKSRVRNLEPSLQAAFVDIGAEKNAFLHYWDMLPATQEMLEDGRDDEDEADEQEEEAEAEETPAVGFFARLRGILGRTKEPEPEPEPKPETSRRRKSSRRGRQRRSPAPRKAFTVEDVPELFQVNSDVLVQVTKGPIGTKGARVTTNLSVPGRYLVLLPNSTHRGVSKRIEDRTERDRLRGIIRRMKLPRGMGVICRTVGAGRDEEVFARDLEMVLEAWSEGEKAVKDKRSPCCVYQEPLLVERALRDFLTEDVDEIVTDSRETHSVAQTMVARLSRGERVKVRLYNNPQPLFQRYRLANQIESIFSRTVALPGGGGIAIDETEALIAIDVNSGKNRTGKDHPETILNTNLEAVDEIARQLRLRDIGGLLVIDFIDMRDRQHRQTVYKTLKTALLQDRAKFKILPISSLGLVEMTRQRQQESLQDRVFMSCPYCNGKGLVKSATTVSVEIQRRVQELLRRRRKQTQLRVTVNPHVLERLRNQDSEHIEKLEEERRGELSFRADPALHIEEFRIQDIDTGADLI